MRQILSAIHCLHQKAHVVCRACRTWGISSISVFVFCDQAIIDCATCLELPDEHLPRAPRAITLVASMDSPDRTKALWFAPPRLVVGKELQTTTSCNALLYA